MKSAVRSVLEKLRHIHSQSGSDIASLFANDPTRFERFSASIGELVYDFSKTTIDDETMALLLQLADAANVEARRDQMFAGEAINVTEGRAVQHMALRAPAGTEVMIDGRNVMPDVLEVRQRMAHFATAVRSGQKVGKGGAFTDVVNIGIGGSDLGPAMAVDALSPYHDGPKVHFVSNVDGADIHDVLSKVPAETTLFIIASKTFTTQETMANAATARRWFVQRCGDEQVPTHFCALSTALDKTAEFGIRPDQTFGFWDWVGGRYSLWSAIGLSLMIAIGESNFEEFLTGGNAVDNHFCTEPLANNLPVLMALIGIYHRNVCGYPTHAILPYDQHLHRFPAYLQQLDMESNGKRVGLNDELVTEDTGPVVWGQPGTNGQHAFYQLIHQGTSIIPADFLIAANAHHPYLEHHEMLIANALAQTEALALGKSVQKARQELVAKGADPDGIEGLALHKSFPGNRPSCTFIYPKLTPYLLGQLIALYEHKIFVQGTIWNINSYDQWGVELGKQLAGELLPLVRGGDATEDRNGSTKGLLAAYHAMKSN